MLYVIQISHTTMKDEDEDFGEADSRQHNVHGLSWNSMIVVHRWPLLNPQLQATKMYGILLQNLAAYIIDKHGERKWNEIKESLKITQVSNYVVFWGFLSIQHYDSYSVRMTLVSRNLFLRVS